MTAVEHCQARLPSLAYFPSLYLFESTLYSESVFAIEVSMKKITFEDKTCLGCGISFNRRVFPCGTMERPRDFLKRKFCSRECESTKTRPEDRVCSYCNSSFNRLSPKEALSQFRRKKFCSRECYDPSRCGRSPQPRKPSEDKMCLECGSPFNRKIGPTGRIEFSKTFETRKFCSSECSAIYHKGVRGNRYKTGVTVRSDGYVVNNLSKNKRHLHREVMEKYLDRPLKSSEIVHHVDGRPGNNFISNLELMTRSEHARLHGKMRYEAGKLKWNNGRFSE